MAFFTTKVDTASIEDKEFSYMEESGVYDITIDFVSVRTNQYGARRLDFNTNKGTLYDLKLDNNDGSENFQRTIFNKLCVIAGIDTVDDPVIETHKIGKDKTPKDFSVLKDFDKLDIKVRVQNVYSLYNGEIKEKKEIRAFYRASDGATAAEIVADKGFGSTLEKDLVYANKDKLNDGITAEEVLAFKSGNTSAPKPTKKATPFQ